MSYDEIVKYYTDLTYVRAQSCKIAWDTILVKANGDVMFCPDEWLTQFKIGNVRDTTVDDMWNNEKARQFRQGIDKVGLFPACARCCVLNG